MSTRNQFPWTRVSCRRGRRDGAQAARAWQPLALALALAVTFVPTRARADAAPAAPASPEEMVLAGPHPMLKENAVSVQFLSGSGIGDSFSGRGVGVGYGYMLQGPLWLDLQMNVRLSACGPFGDCRTFTGDDAELIAGVAWRFRTDIPLVPMVRAGVGLVYLYPDGAANAIGLAARAGAGLKYYVFDWLGFGIEAALSLGHGYFDSNYQGGRRYAVGDLVLGVEYQFR